MSKRTGSPGFGKRLKLLREHMGLNQSEFARRAGIILPSYRAWEVHDSAPSAGTLKRALQSVGAPDWLDTLAWLPDGQGPMPQWAAFIGAAPAPSHDGASKAVVPGSASPMAPSSPSPIGRSVVALLEKGIGSAVELIKRGENAMPTLESLIRIAREAQASGLASILVTIAMLYGMTKTAGAYCNSGSSELTLIRVQVPASAVIRLLIRLLELIRAALRRSARGPINHDDTGASPRGPKTDAA